MDSENEKFYFCGKFSGVPETEAEVRRRDAIEELFVYANGASYYFADHFLLANDTTDIVELNPDVEYYLQAIVSRNSGRALDADAPGRLDEVLDEERRAFLSDAAVRFDIEAVLATTPPCPSRE